MFRGNPGLTGFTGATLPNTLSLSWSFKTGGPVKSSPAIVGDRVYIGSDDGHLYALNTKDGTKAWAFKTEGPIESSPLVLDGRVYFGSADGALYAVDAKSGQLAWKTMTGDKILGAPNWVAGADKKSKSIVVGSYDYRLYSMDAGTGKTNWSYETGNYINGAPAVSEGVTVFGGCDALLHVISLEKGEKVKEIEAGAYMAGSGALDKKRFYIGHYDNEFLSADLDKGEISWKYRDRNFPYFSSPALTADRVVFGGRDKQVHCINRADGKQVWTFATRGKVDSSPVIAQDKVVVGSEDGRLYMIGLKDGAELWNYDLGQAVTSSPGVINNLVVVGSEDGNVHAFGPAKGNKR
ncbi:MAG TPA: PQQ-binding-like beta-propeller repeat protein [Methylomirabilota bacterium]|nr:PQQ-binding-like beta-propeller repeat protein [Methylomirabilota bacterium]